MTTPKSTFARLALIAGLCAGFILGLTVPASAGYDEGAAAFKRGDYAAALRELRPLADQGNVAAQWLVYSMYSNGQGVPQDHAKAARWSRKAAEQGMAEAQGNLGFIYEDGQGVPQDHVQAHMWFGLAASSFPPGEDRDTAVKYRDIVAEKMTPAQISEAQKLAREWKPK